MDYATLNEKGLNVIGHIFKDGRIPLRSILMTLANICGCQDAFYMCDWLRLSQRQKDAMNDFMIVDRGVPAEQIDECLETFNFCVPIHSDLVSWISSDEMRKYS